MSRELLSTICVSSQMSNDFRLVKNSTSHVMGIEDLLRARLVICTSHRGRPDAFHTIITWVDRDRADVRLRTIQAVTRSYLLTLYCWAYYQLHRLGQCRVRSTAQRISVDKCCPYHGL